MLRHRLHFGPYRTPRFRIGQRVEDLRRGLVRIVGLSDGPIPWPIGQTQRAKSLVLYRDLARAVRWESNAAVAHWWGVGRLAVRKWRKALGVGWYNEGDRRLRVANGRTNVRAIQAMHAKARDPVRRAKIAASRRGMKLSAATRAKMSAAHKARGTWPPAARKPQTSDGLSQT